MSSTQLKNALARKKQQQQQQRRAQRKRRQLGGVRVAKVKLTRQQLRQRRTQAFKVFQTEMAAKNFLGIWPGTFRQQPRFLAACSWTRQVEDAAYWLSVGLSCHGRLLPMNKQYILCEDLRQQQLSQLAQPNIDTIVCQLSQYCIIWIKLHTHCNVLVLDTTTKTAWIFEPHGVAKPHAIGLVKEFVRDKYRIRSVYTSAVGPQHLETRSAFNRELTAVGLKHGKCVIWCAIFIHVLVGNRDKPNASQLSAQQLVSFTDPNSVSLLALSYLNGVMFALNIKQGNEAAASQGCAVINFQSY